MRSFQLTSNSFTKNSKIPSKYTCDGENVSPQLTIMGTPPPTKSLVIIVDDPDSPSGQFIHWILYNLTPDNTTISEGSIPSGSQEGMNSFGNKGYGGPCPHQGLHHYVFTLFALNIRLELNNPSIKELQSAIKGNIIEEARLIGLYQRK